jgi:diacylglycerol kinase
MRTISNSLSFSRFAKATGYASSGVYYAFLNEPSFPRIAIAEVTIATVMWLFLRPLSLIEIAILVMAAALVFITEIINTSIETLVDMVQSEQDARVKIIKNCAAGATLLASCSGLAACLFIILNHILRR